MTKNNVIDYTIDAKVAISIFLLTEQADGTSKQETIRRNIEVNVPRPARWRGAKRANWERTPLLQTIGPAGPSAPNRGAMV